MQVCFGIDVHPLYPAAQGIGVETKQQCGPVFSPETSLALAQRLENMNFVKRVQLCQFVFLISFRR